MKMSIIMGISLLTGLTGGPARSALSDDQTTAAAAAAKADAATPGGEKYQETVGQAFARDHGVTVGQCAKATKRPDLSDFDLLLRVKAEGVVEEVLVKPRTNLSGCVQGKLTGWKVPGPPHAGFWVGVAVNLKRK
jgi:hypothetical protein